MKSISLKEVNKAASELVDTKSDKQLYTQIAEIARTLIGADFVKLFLVDKERLKKAYYSDTLVKSNNPISDKNFSSILSANEIRYLKKEDLQRLQLKQFPSEVNSLMVIPLLHSQQLLGFIFLYFLTEKPDLSQTEHELLILYSHMVVLAINKAKLQQESQKALEIRDRFISLASHELRTPLTSIHGYIQLLYSRMKNKDTLESRWTNELYIESIRLTTLVKELLDVNRIKQGQFAFVFSEVPLQDVVTRAIDRYKFINASHPFDFQCRLTNHQTRIVGDFDKLVEMVSGILGNAVKFSKPDEKIVITLRHINGMLTLEVKDKGKGISKKDMAAIQNGFYKPEYASYIEGMGVGIMLARHIIENHRGKLKIKSKENEGTTVTVSLPTIKSAN
jgi:signal transduction histidine kinase